MSSQNVYLETDRTFRDQSDSNNLMLRQYNDRRKQSVQFQNSRKERRQNHLQEMLVRNFVAKIAFIPQNQYEKQQQSSNEEFQVSEKDQEQILLIVKKEFNQFLSIQKQFTEKNLIQFENKLLLDLKTLIQQNRNLKNFAIISTKQKSQFEKSNNYPKNFQGVLKTQRPLIFDKQEDQNNLNVNQNQNLLKRGNTAQIVNQTYRKQRILENIETQNNKSSLPSIDIFKVQSEKKGNKENQFLKTNYNLNDIKSIQDAISLKKEKKQATQPLRHVHTVIEQPIEHNQSLQKDIKIKSLKDFQDQKISSFNQYQGVNKNTNRGQLNVITDTNYNILSPKTAYGEVQLKYDNPFKDKNKSQSLNKKSIQNLSIDNIWGEINNYMAEQHEEEKRKRYQQKIQKREALQKTLNTQIQIRDQNLKEIKQKNDQIDQFMLKKCKIELQKEEKQMFEHKKKVELQKIQRDVMLLEAQRQRIEREQQLKEKEKEEVQILQKEIQKEKETKLKKKFDERNSCWKVIEQNEKEKIKKQQEKQLEKLKEIKTLEDYDKMLEMQEKKRAKETAERECRVQQIINRMGDAFKKNSDEEKRFELQILHDAMQKEKKAEKQEILQKELKLQKNQELNRKLQEQVQMKMKLKEKEQEDNLKIVEMILCQDELDNRLKQEKEQAALQKRKEVQQIQLKQIKQRQLQGVGVDSSGLAQIQNKTQFLTALYPLQQQEESELFKRKPFVGTKTKFTNLMSLEELKINKKLLEEISKKKQQKFIVQNSNDLTQYENQ